MYAAENRALAVLETLVHIQPQRLPNDLVMLTIQIPDDVPQHHWAIGDLPDSWRSVGSERVLDRGDAWLASNTAAVLWAPSAILPEERNAILNPAHPSHAAVRVVARQPFEFDTRLLV